MEVFEFVSHAPSDYFKDRRAPYPTLTSKPEIGKFYIRGKNAFIERVVGSKVFLGYYHLDL